MDARRPDRSALAATATIRPERPDDIAAVRRVNLAAFDSPTEADLVDALRVEADPIVSLVADANGSIVGHILFSPATLSNDASLRVMGLAPMAVLPAAQRRGIGSALVRGGLERCRHIGCEAVIVLGHSSYYPRFGFLPASCFGLRSEYDVPDDVFMALELEPGILKGKSGTMRYHAAFGRV